MIHGEAIDITSYTNVELVRPLPAIGEDELGVRVKTTTDAANTAAGSGLHEATCSPLVSFEGTDHRLARKRFGAINSIGAK